MEKKKSIFNMRHIKLYENFDQSASREELAASLEPLAKQLQEAISGIFTESFVNCKVSKGLGVSISIGFTLGKDKTEWKNGIAENDPAKHSIVIWPEHGQLSVESSGGTLMVKPPEGSHLAYGRIKTGWRNFKTKNEADVVRKLTDYFTKLKKLIADNVDNFKGEDAELAKAKTK